MPKTLEHAKNIPRLKNDEESFFGQLFEYCTASRTDTELFLG